MICLKRALISDRLKRMCEISFPDAVGGNPHHVNPMLVMALANALEWRILPFTRT